MNISISKVCTADDITAVVRLAEKIWRQHFTSIIGADQVEYMLAKFQSTDAIKQQLNSGGKYYIAAVEKRKIGYIAIVPDNINCKMMISKIYVKDDSRDLGIGTRLLEFVEKACRKRKFHTIWLTVNRHNHGPIKWYRHNGFEIVDEVKKDIGDGFYMDDFIMEKKVRSNDD